ncbi:MAG: beta-propeller domain-containing protein [Bacillota bacterium]
MMIKRGALSVALVTALIIVFALALQASSFAATAPSIIKVVFNSKQLVSAVNPVLKDGRVMISPQSFYSAMGAKYTWDSKTNTITATKGSITLKMTAGKKTAYRNGRAYPMDVAPIMVKGKILIPARFITEAFGLNILYNSKTKTLTIENNKLPVVGSLGNLKKLLAAAQNSGQGAYRSGMDSDMKITLQDGAESAAAPSTGASADYSATNVQVQGVDESDVAKTDGEYIYQVNNQRVVVAKVYPVSGMKIVSTLKFAENYSPRELYVDQKYMVVIGSSYRQYPGPVPLAPEPGVAAPDEPAAKRIAIGEIYPYRHTETTKAIIYDISDKTQIKQLREVELEGYYVSSRKIGSALYLVANNYIDYYTIMEQGQGSPTPAYRDTAGAKNFVNVRYQDIRYFPNSVEPNYLMVAGLNLNNPEQETQVSTYLGSGQNVYASTKNLYVAVTMYAQTLDQPAVMPIPGDTKPAIIMPPAASNTVVYKFALNQGKVEYKGKGEVPGTILNQFSMDEHNGFFRIATTKGDLWRNDEYTAKNNIYVLNDVLQMTGKIEDIAPGERIYSVRFMGVRGYMVTFKNVDPLFVIDLKNPQKPMILGALKIPGYSDYLHPYDDNHIIGFGKDTVELPQKDWEGNSAGTMAFYQGMKIAMFDVTDVTKPVEMFKELIGDRGTYSELLNNHKALLFSKEKNLMSFPVNLMEIKQALSSPDIPAYGEFTFQGAYVYNVDLVNGFTLKGRITHISAEDLLKSGDYWYDGNNYVNRILYIGDTLYTLSNAKIMANDIATLKEKGSLPIPQ